MIVERSAALGPSISGQMPLTAVRRALKALSLNIHVRYLTFVNEIANSLHSRTTDRSARVHPTPRRAVLRIGRYGMKQRSTQW
ncbi:hypothetical protein EVAR_55958_1 [Eumeta japonica]|uniref:Uncharacterized protein n=1 Tax=Eumeta variegata TaxID=151549 RepID=A0A4C1YW92_EUMVA|nr:hypothetical protein EVAR_55958_1 [Eumeta japonica]